MASEASSAPCETSDGHGDLEHTVTLVGDQIEDAHDLFERENRCVTSGPVSSRLARIVSISRRMRSLPPGSVHTETGQSGAEVIVGNRNVVRIVSVLIMNPPSALPAIAPLRLQVRNVARKHRCDLNGMRRDHKMGCTRDRT